MITPSYSFHKNCHRGNIQVFKKGLVTVYGGGQSRGAEYTPEYVILDIGAGVGPFFILRGIVLPKFLSRAPELRVIEVDWPDYGIPFLDAKDWQNLVADLIGIAKKEEGLSLLVSCTGGHGRTGTALAILAHFFGVGSKDFGQYVRDNYCQEAIESKSQIEYIQEMTGTKTKIKPNEPPPMVYQSYQFGKDKKDKDGKSESLPDDLWKDWEQPL